MLKVIISLLLFSAAPVAAQSVEYCKHIENIASAAMTSRQAGIPLKTMLNLVTDQTAIGVFEAAYEYPQLESEADRKAAILEFKELVVSECLK